MNKPTAALAILVTLLAAACSGGGSGSVVGSTPQPPQPPAPPPPPPPVQANCQVRVDFCADDMLAAAAARLVSNSTYAPVVGANSAIHDFNGTLTTQTSPLMGSNFGDMPGFTVEFISVDGALIPMERGIISSGGLLDGELILSTGRIWSEAGDGGMSRAAFPFTITGKLYNATHNGLATFVFDNNRISPVYFQMTQETDPLNQLDLWGRMDATYTPEIFADIASREQAWRAQVANRIAVRPWSDLENAVGAAELAVFTRDLDDLDISGGGIVVDDTLYFLPASTRQGNYPFALEMRHGVFSVTKSMLAAVAMLRLAEKYDPSVFDLFVSDYINVTASHVGWNGVTFGHLLSMTAGIGDNLPDQSIRSTFADENDQASEKWNAFFSAPDKAGKLEAAFSYNNYPWGPGQVARYNSTHSFVLAAAVDGFLKSVEGPDADLVTMLQEEVFVPLGLLDFPILQTIEDNGEDSLPIFAFGLYPNAYESARILQLLQNEGVYDGEQILHRDSLLRALRRIPVTDFETSISISTGSNSLPVRYLYSYYSFDMQTEDGCNVTPTYMEGFGGNNVVLLPNGVAAFRYSDSGLFDPGAIALAASRVRPNC